MGEPDKAPRRQHVARPTESRVRWTYQLTWREPEIGDLRFFVLVHAVNDGDGLFVNDWIPLDGATWQGMARIVEPR